MKPQQIRKFAPDLLRNAVRTSVAMA